ncbi:MAG: hypothetical protein ACI4BB_12540, partial [Coprococcus sp.]
RCLDGDVFGPGFDSPQVHYLKMPEMLDFRAFFVASKTAKMSFQTVSDRLKSKKLGSKLGSKYDATY